MKKTLLLLLILICCIPLYSVPKKKFAPEKTEEVKKEDSQQTDSKQKEKKKAKKKSKVQKTKEPQLVPVSKKPAKPKKKTVKKAVVKPKKVVTKQKKTVPVKTAGKPKEPAKKEAVTKQEKKILPPEKDPAKTKMVAEEKEKKAVPVKTADKPEEPAKKDAAVKTTPAKKADTKKDVAKKTFNRYFSEKSTSKLPFFLEAAPSTAYGTGLLAGGQTSNESAYYFEGVKIPFTNNFLTGTSIINSNLINRYTYTGAYGPELGDSSGSVINISLKNPRSDRVGGFFDIGLLGASFLSEGKISESDSFSLSIDYEPEDLFTDIAFDNEHSLASSSNLGGHARYVHSFNKKNSIKMTVIGARNKISHLSAYKKNGVPNLGETLAPEAMFILAKGDQEYRGESLDSRLTGSFMLSSWEYPVYNRDNFSTIDYRGTIEEHLSWKINCHNRIDFGAVFMAGIFSTETRSSLLPIEGEPGMIHTFNTFGYSENVGYIHPSIYLKYRLSASGLEIVPGVHISGDFHNREEWSGTIDPRLYLAYTVKDMVKIYASGGLYSRRPEYEMTLFGFGNEALDYEKSAHSKFGINVNLKGFFADVSGFYKYHFNLITRDPEDAAGYDNLGKGWSAGTEIKAGYKNKYLNTWIAYTFLKSERKNSKTLDYRKSDGDIPHNLKAALSYRFHKNWNFSGDITVASGLLVSQIDGSNYFADGEIYLPVTSYDGINSSRLSGLISYGAKLEYFIFLNNIRLGIYAKAKGTKATIDYIYNSDYTDRTTLHLTPVLGTIGITGEF